MPILKHAIKKIRTDKRRAVVNARVRTKAKGAIKQVRSNPTDVTLLSQAFSAIDRAAKIFVFHPRKADRLKSRLTALHTKTISKK
jgi:ribosomal protein S20